MSELKEGQVYDVKLKHEIDERWLDLNTLTLEELSEYVELSKDAIRACNRIETFINYRK